MMANLTEVRIVPAEHSTQNLKKAKLLTTKNLVIIAMMAALASVFYMCLELPIIPFAPHLKVNFADVPSLICGVLISPLAGSVVVLVRCVIHLFITSTFGIGELMDLIVGVSMVVPTVVVYNFCSRKNLNLALTYIFSAVTAIIATIISGLIGNALLYPLFISLIGQAIESAEAFVVYLGSTVITNVIRSIATLIVCAVFMPFMKTFKRIVSR